MRASTATQTTQGNPPKAEVVAARRRGLFAEHQDRAARRLRRLLGARATIRRRARRPATTARSASRRTRSSPQTAPRADRDASPTRSRTASSQPSRQQPRRADQRRHQHQLRRSEQHGAARAAVLGGPAARVVRAVSRSRVSYIGARGDHLRPRRIERHRRSTSTSSIRSTWRSARALERQPVPNPFFGNRERRAARDPGDARPRAAAAPVSAVRATSTRGHVLEGKNRYNAAVIEWSKRMTHGWGGRVSYTYSVLKDNQIGEGNFYSPARPPARSTTTTTSQHAGVHRHELRRVLQPGCGLRRQPARRAAPRHHRADRRAAVRQGQEVGAATAAPRTGSSAAGRSSAAINMQSGFPLSVDADRQHRHLFGGVPAAEHRVRRRLWPRRAASRIAWPRPITRPRRG